MDEHEMPMNLESWGATPDPRHVPNPSCPCGPTPYSVILAGGGGFAIRWHHHDWDDPFAQRVSELQDAVDALKSWARG